MVNIDVKAIQLDYYLHEMRNKFFPVPPQERNLFYWGATT